jgi:hypothetical protein
MERLMIPENIKNIYKRKCELQKQIAGVEKRLLTEKENVENFTTRIEKLESLAAESVAGNDKSYERFKSDIKKKTAQLDTSKELAIKLQSMLRPLQNELSAHRHNLTISLENYSFEYRFLADKEFELLLEPAMLFIETFLGDLKSIYESFGEKFWENENILPGQLPVSLLHEYRQKKLEWEAVQKPIPVQTEASEGGQCPPLEPIHNPQDATVAASGEKNLINGCLTPSGLLSPSELVQDAANIPSDSRLG